MSLEQKIEALTAAVEANTAMLQGIAKAGAAAGTKPAATGTKPAGTKPATTKKTGPTQEEVAERFGAYLKVSDKDERKERIANMGKINAHFGVAKITDAEPAQWKEALELLDKLEAGEDPFEDEGEGDDGSLI